jgi:hypothetical protein
VRHHLGHALHLHVLLQALVVVLPYQRGQVVVELLVLSLAQVLAVRRAKSR